ncbi:Hypothetical predicted protein [Paramuricea clavata]|uniref:Uncharacterized protein n=1 Tax=Paramuricea clavata TaxID=317549 RepID=A0A7D9DH71_PARCT|nr:Hypothetical predicted protein [Paramuricea clavata]
MSLQIKRCPKYSLFMVNQLARQVRNVSYIQGQSPSPNVREYFYYIDHQGQLFLHDARLKNFITCFKEKKFLTFFFRRLKMNNTGRYEEFPYISPCGKEFNYIQCDDRPIVYTSITNSSDNTQELLDINGTEKLTYPFQPEKICMFPETGRIYHPADEKYGGVGLIKSSLGIELSHCFEYRDRDNEREPPSHFNWNGKTYELDNSLWSEILTVK